MEVPEWAWKASQPAMGAIFLAVAGWIGMLARKGGKAFWARIKHNSDLLETVAVETAHLKKDNAAQTEAMRVQAEATCVQAESQRAMTADILKLRETVAEHGKAIEIIKAQVLPNGGKSLNDAVMRLDAKFAIVAAESDAEFKHRQDIAVRTHANGGIRCVTEGYTKITGLTSHEAMHDGWRNVIHPRDRARVVREWEEAIQNRRHATICFRFIRRDRGARGEMIAVESIAETIRNPQPKPNGEPGDVLGWNSVIETRGEWEPLNETAADPFAS